MKLNNALLTLTFLCLSTLAFAGGKLWIKGSVIDPLREFDEVTLEVVVNGNEFHEIPFSKKGDFQIRIYDNESYTLQFKRDGYITKTIMIDTTVPDETGLVGNIKFNLVMKRQGRLDPSEMLCAHYTWSDPEQTLVYTTPESDDIEYAFNK